MAAPNLLEVYPADGDTGIPVGASIRLDFDKGIDVTTLDNYVVLYGADFDQTSGPDSALWIDHDTGDNPFFLASPGFKGLVDLDYRVVYYDLDTGEDTTPGSLYAETDEASESTGGVGHRVYVTPKSGQLAADTEYTLHIIGDPDAQGVGISSRTVFDVEPEFGNTGSGVLYASGGYTGTSPDEIALEITTAGDMGVAKYRWYYVSEGVGTAVYDKVTNRRYRNLSNGVQVRFSGTGFVVGDTWTIYVEPMQRLATNTKVVFTTNDGTYVEAPESPSTPAPSEPPATSIPPAPGDTTDTTYLQVVEMDPPNGAYGTSTNTRTITITFDGDLDDTTVTQQAVRLYRYPALGIFQGQAEPIELQKKLTVSGDQLVIEI